MTQTQRTERKILWISFGSGLLFAVIELMMAIYSHSQSVLMDAVYDASELIIIGLTLALVPLFHKPVSEKHPFGYSQIESIFIIIKGFMMLSVTLGLTISSIEVALSGGNNVNAIQISLFQLILGGLSLIILLIMMYFNRSISSPTVKAEIYGWRIDVFYSLGMSLAFFLSIFFKGTRLEFISPYFDQIILIFIVIFMLPENIKMLFRAIKDVFLFSPEDETMEKIKNVSEQVLKEYSFVPVFYDVTRTGRRLWVVIYFSIEEETLCLKKLNKAIEDVNSSISDKFDNCIVELMVSTEYYNQADHDLL